MKNFAAWVLVFFCSTSLWGANGSPQTQLCGCHKIVAMRAAAFPDIEKSDIVLPLSSPEKREKYRRYVLTTLPKNFNLINELEKKIINGVNANHITDELIITAIAYDFLTTPYPSQEDQEDFDLFVIGSCKE